jgi:hypothetical protein
MEIARIVNGNRVKIAHPLAASQSPFPRGNEAITRSTLSCRAGVGEAGVALEYK